ncbi:uncharacterized protein [Antedon mediterranea]|uniref:uncharacterized protein n=1 Tax=Antedon mediterranea TaxID=105859 RepID=UPI003AF73B16
MPSSTQKVQPTTEVSTRQTADGSPTQRPTDDGTPQTQKHVTTVEAVTTNLQQTEGMPSSTQKVQPTTEVSTRQTADGSPTQDFDKTDILTTQSQKTNLVSKGTQQHTAEEEFTTKPHKTNYVVNITTLQTKLSTGSEPTTKRQQKETTEYYSTSNPPSEGLTLTYLIIISVLSAFVVLFLLILILLICSYLRRRHPIEESKAEDLDFDEPPPHVDQDFFSNFTGIPRARLSFQHDVLDKFDYYNEGYSEFEATSQVMYVRRTNRVSQSNWERDPSYEPSNTGPSFKTNRGYEKGYEDSELIPMNSMGETKASYGFPVY